MNIWIITTGSSDVQLKHEKNWNSLHSKVRNQLETQKQFSSSRSPDGKRFLYPARVMGVVYGTAIENNLKHYEDLDFPLLNNFFWILEGKDGKSDKIIIDRVIVLVTNQSEKFKVSDKNNPFSAFWQDTCTLQPILEEYFKRKSIANPEFLVLDPDPKKSSGLDNWNDVLERVQEKYKEKFADFKDVSKDITIYVSHQAGTPAISSAVQFCSLAKFGDRVKFLVSNEYDPTLTSFVESSSYLRGIELQQAKKLLKRHDYSGIKEVLKRQIDEACKRQDKPEPQDEKLKHIACLLDVAIQWNFAKFEKFADQIEQLPEDFQALVQEIGKRRQHWWWTAYEAAWLGVVRLKQENTVEAMFHSFRALEGLAIRYALNKGLNRHGKKVFRYLKSQKQKQWKEHSFINKLVNLEEETDLSAEVDILGCRNTLFHQLSGFTKNNLFDAWNTNEEDWQEVVVECLNFISDQNFVSIEEVSLMAQVHKELKKAIDHLDLNSPEVDGCKSLS